MMEDAIIKAVLQEGFPAFVAAFLLLRLQKSIDNIRAELRDISRWLRRLDEAYDERERRRAFSG